VTVSWVAGIVLGLTLLVSGVAKLASRSWSTQARSLRIPQPIATTLPIVELVLGAALVTDLGYPAVAWAAAALLLVFTAFIALSLATGRRPSCACFGAWSSRPIGPLSLLRNAALLLLAGIAAFG
jgi:uncharacterized membrane protein YphA (DoxX/SURF4 family)